MSWQARHFDASVNLAGLQQASPDMKGNSKAGRKREPGRWSSLAFFSPSVRRFSVAWASNHEMDRYAMLWPKRTLRQLGWGVGVKGQKGSSKREKLLKLGRI